jgi:hypothetical protein
MAASLVINALKIVFDPRHKKNGNFTGKAIPIQWHKPIRNLPYFFHQNHQSFYIQQMPNFFEK